MTSTGAPGSGSTPDPPKVTIVIHEQPHSPSDLNLVRRYGCPHRWAYLAAGGIACGYCGMPKP